MKLSTRLILLIIVCLLPVFVAQIYTQMTLNTAERQEAHSAARQQIDAAAADVRSIVDGASQLGQIIASNPDLRVSGPGCDERLLAIRQALPRYTFLSVVDPVTGATFCTTNSTLRTVGQDWFANLLPARDIAVGSFVKADHGLWFLPIGVHLPAAAATQPAVLIAGLDLAWLAHHLDLAQAVQIDAAQHAMLIIADRNGVVLNGSPNDDARSGQSLPDWLQPLLKHDQAGSETVADKAGRHYLATFELEGAPSRGLMVINLVPVDQAAPQIETIRWQNISVIMIAAVAALLLAWIAGRRFIHQSTESLLQAARKWREGDLTARAELQDAGSEFAHLAESFNAMAAGLAARETERKMQASFLEARVAERTRELSETNNRLQVEIAGREKTEAALHQAQKLQAVGQLAGGIAHDFNNLLATVLGNLELMERRVSQANEKWGSAETERLLRLIERAVGAVQRGSQLTSRLLAFSRRQRLAARSTDINALLQELITLATSTLGRRIQVVPELNEAVWPAMVDPSQLEAAILNLCLNARDAMPEGGKLTIRTGKLRILPGRSPEGTDLPPGEYVQVFIEDTGIGMSPEVKARAFEPFFTTKGPGAGSGLGLSQVYGLARQSGGAVTLDSALGQGTQVILTLPRAAADTNEASEPAEKAAPEIEVPTATDDLILVVDDDHAVRQVTVEMARDLGCEVAQAAGGEQALALLDKLSPPPRLILLDYAMPGMNGLQLARAIRERGITAPIALVTGYAELTEADVQGGELSGLLRKPFTIRELQAMVNQLRAAAIPPARVLEAGLETG